MPREMFQAFPGDYDSGSRCSSSPSAESQYLSSVDSFGSPPTAAASQVSSRSQRCYFWWLCEKKKCFFQAKVWIEHPLK